MILGRNGFMTDPKQKKMRDERLVPTRSSAGTPRGLVSPRPRAGTLRPRPQIRKLQCSLNNGTLAADAAKADAANMTETVIGSANGA